MPASRRLTVGLVVAAAAVPAATVAALQAVPDSRTLVVHRSPVSHFPPSPLALRPVPVGPPPAYRPQITHVQIVDLDKSGKPGVLAADGQKGRLFYYTPNTGGGYDERPVGGELHVPGPFHVVDLDGDGDLDVVVSVLGSVYPTDDRVGQVVWLENVGGGKFVNHLILDDLRRVTDVRAADFNGDGKLDLAVAVYGFEHGEILWLENRGGGKFRDHLLFASMGPSHVPVADFDGDGRPDIAALVSQDHEEVWLFHNDGGGKFTPKRVHGFLNFDTGSAGLVTCDLNKDGKPDLLLSAGDNLEINHHFPQAWHGVYWLENLGNNEFKFREVGRVGGVYAAAAADFDGDGHVDVVAASMFNDWRAPGAASLVLLKNDGQFHFTPTTLADRPIHLATVAAGDLDGDGKPDVVAGVIHLDTLALPDRAGRIAAWLSRTGGTK